MEIYQTLLNKIATIEDELIDAITDEANKKLAYDNNFSLDISTPTNRSRDEGGYEMMENVHFDSANCLEVTVDGKNVNVHELDLMERMNLLYALR